MEHEGPEARRARIHRTSLLLFSSPFHPSPSSPHIEIKVHSLTRRTQPDTRWRNRGTFLTGRAEVEQFLSEKWAIENGYRLRKELFAFTDDKIAVYVRSPLPFPLRISTDSVGVGIVLL